MRIAVLLTMIIFAFGVSAVSAQQTRSAAFNFFVRAATQAYDLGVWPDSLSETIGDYIVEDYIAPATNETEAEIVQRIKQGPQRLSTAQLVRQVKDGVVLILTPDGSGSGFIVDSQGRVVTNQHVVRGHPGVAVQLVDGRTCSARVLGAHAIPDLAVVDIVDCTGFKALPLGNSSALEVGEDVVTVGYPMYGVARMGEEELNPTVSRGIVSAKRLYRGLEQIQTDAAINPGNSGGPLLNYYGQVVGVNTWGIPIDVADNMGFAIASNELKHRLTHLIRGETPAEGNREWVKYEHPFYGYSLTVPPTWGQTRRYEEPEYSHWQWEPPGNHAYVSVHVSKVHPNFTMEDFEAWRMRYLRQMSDRWEMVQLIGGWSIRADEHGPPKVIMAYVAQYAEENCVEGFAELWVIASMSRSTKHTYLMKTSVCQHTYEMHDDDRWDIMESFKIVGR